jgi:ATP-dependent helicase/nuclease subunit A
MTIHHAKGLEWPVVIVPDLAVQTGGWGDRLLVDSEIGIAFEIEDESYNKSKPAIFELIKKRIRATEREEEKRLLYVAVTRARDQVLLTTGPEVKKNTLIELLMPGIQAAKIAITPIPFSADLAIPSTPLDPPPFEEPRYVNTGTARAGLRTVPITGMTEYAVCPKKFRYRYVDGHPGLGEGEARARTIGTLAHKALEFCTDNFERLKTLAEDASPESITEALDLAQRFRHDKVFAKFQGLTVLREQSVLIRHREADLVGVVDMVGDNFVLDYKTDAEITPDEHRFQLWAYAAALSKRAAFIAYLRKPYLHEFSAKELAETGKAAGGLIDNIIAGNFDAKPSVKKCGRCVYSDICASSLATSPVLQLKLFN